MNKRPPLRRSAPVEQEHEGVIEGRSHTRIRGGSPRSRAAERMSSTLAYSRTAARAMTPWWGFGN
mgnify:CR=1 FL=1